MPALIARLTRWIGRALKADDYAAPDTLIIRHDAFAQLEAYTSAMRTVPQREAYLAGTMRSWSPSFTYAAAKRRAFARRRP